MPSSIRTEVFAPAFSILDEAIAERAFPAASIAVTHRGRLVAQEPSAISPYESD